MTEPQIVVVVFIALFAFAMLVNGTREGRRAQREIDALMPTSQYVLDLVERQRREREGQQP